MSDEYVYDAYCGLYCGACHILIANEAGNLAERAAAWNQDAAALVCRGCKAEIVAAHCADCEMRRCARARALTSCGECADYPCETLRSFRDDGYAHHAAVVKNLEAGRELGREGWLAAQDARWRCPACRTRFGWYDKKCPACGGPVTNAIAEAEGSAG
jgi:hypothetical protein